MSRSRWNLQTGLACWCQDVRFVCKTHILSPNWFWDASHSVETGVYHFNEWTTNNYRSISLTNIPCKMIEHIVLHYMNQKLDDFLHIRQHAFRRDMSYKTQLSATFNELARTAEAKKTTHAVVLDFRNAFDKVPHALLVQKLKQIPDMHPQLVNCVQVFSDEQKAESCY